MTLGQTIKHFRESKGFKQYGLAVKAYISKESLNQYERDTREPKFSTLVFILKALDVSLSEFFREVDICQDLKQ